MSAKRYFEIERPKLGLEFSYEFEKDERKGPYINSENRTMTYSEGLNIETKGWFYHPALVIYKLKVSPEWEQTSEESDGGERRASKAFLQDYSTEFTFLQHKPYTLSIFADRRMSTLKSSFANRSKTESDIYGAALALKYKVLPTSLSYRHLKSRQTGFYITDKDTNEFYLGIYNDNLGDTRLTASYKDGTQTTNRILVSTLQQTASLKNSYNLTEDERVTLSSGLNYRGSQSGLTESTRYDFYENLSWRHRKNLTTRYSFRYGISDSETTSDGITDSVTTSSESRVLRFNLNHLLYENLTTSLNVDGDSSSFTGGEKLNYGAGLNFNYRRRIPRGMLNINMGHNYRISKSVITANFIQITDASITLTGYEITLLTNEHVDINSIVVTDNADVPYLKDIDYRVTEIGSSIGISRKIGTGITDGEEVYVSYSYLSNPAFDYSIFGQSYGVNLNLWSAWMIYYRFNHFKQKVISGIPPDRIIDDSIHNAGTAFNWKWSRTKFEFKDSDVAYVPTTSWSAEETVTIRPFRNVFFSFYGNYGKSKFKDTGEIEKFNSIRANIQMLTSRRSRFRVEGFRNKSLGLSGRTTDSGISLTFEWFYRIWNGKLRYRFLNEKDEISQETRKNHYILFEVKRRLF